jgi:hypothetical protein
MEIKKFRLKKNRDINSFKQTVIINKKLAYNLKVKRVITA